MVNIVLMVKVRCLLYTVGSLLLVLHSSLIFDRTVQAMLFFRQQSRMGGYGTEASL